MALSAGPKRRSPPVVIQTSALDCGPASLSSLLRGIGAPGAYEPLRDVCATDVDGTSIDAMEAVAAQVGADAEQLVLPAEHILAMPQEYLPAIAVVVLPDGFPHFVVAWRRTRRHVIVMDPAVGLRRIPHRQFLSMLYRHSLDVPAEAWREWAGSDVFTTALRRRLDAVGRSGAEVDAALVDPSPRSLALLDASVRAAERDNPAQALVWDATASSDLFSCTPAEDPDTVGLHGAVIVRARSHDPSAGDAGLVDRLSADEPRPVEIVAGLLARPRVWLARLMVAAAALAGVSVATDASLQPLLHRTGGDSLGMLQVVLFCLATLAILGVTALALTAGRQLESRLRGAWWDLVSHLPDAFMRSRPASDITDRGHLLHRVRELPVHLVRSVVSLVVLAISCVVICALVPAATPFALGLLAVTVAVPVMTFKRVAEADFQTRTVAGALSRFSSDSLLGAEAVRATSAASAIEYEQAALLRAWRRAQMRFVLLTSGVRAVTGVLGAALAAACTTVTTLEPGRGLFVAVLAVLSVDAGAVITESLRTLAEGRASIARVAGPLATTRAEPAHSSISATAEVEFDEVSVRLGAAEILTDVSVSFPPGSRTALVGASGSGKSSLTAVLLGWLEPSAGKVHWGGQALDAAALRRVTAWASPETRLWNDGLAENVEYGSSPGAASVDERLAAADGHSLSGLLHRRADRRLGEAGGALSDGEAQRVRFARALGRPDAALVVLDEAFRGLERERRSRLLTGALRQWSSATVVCALHDIEDALAFDRVVVMAGGRVVETGVPTALAADPNSQFAAMLAADRADLFGGFARVQVGQESR